MRLFFRVKLSIGPSIQAPTLVCCIQTLSTTESLIAPPIALSGEVSSRAVTSPMIAKSLKFTFSLGPPSGPYFP